MLRRAPLPRAKKDMKACQVHSLTWILALAMAGCASTVPYVGQGPHPQISRGRPAPPIDFLGNVFALPVKLILFNWKVDNHAVSSATEADLTEYLNAPESRTAGTHFSLNEYNPGLALSRLVHNHKVAWPYRVLLGLPLTLITDVLLPGRLFAGFVGGDSYNPYTDTVAIYSDLSSIALHEAGHAHDFNARRYKGTYAAIRLIPFVDLYQEYQATDEAVNHFIAVQKRDRELESYKVLYPAYGTYVGGYVPFPGVSVAGALLGHLVGRVKAHARQRYYTALNAANAAGRVGP